MELLFILKLQSISKLLAPKEIDVVLFYKLKKNQEQKAEANNMVTQEARDKAVADAKAAGAKEAEQAAREMAARRRANAARQKAAGKVLAQCPAVSPLICLSSRAMRSHRIVLCHFVHCVRYVFVASWPPHALISE